MSAHSASQVSTAPVAETTPPPAAAAVSTKALWAYIVVCIAWGTTLFSIKIGVESVPAFLFSGARYGVAGVVMMLALKAFGYRWPHPSDWKVIVGSGVLLLAGANALTAWAERAISSSFAAIVFLGSPIMYVVMARLLGERMAPRVWWGLAIGSLGFVLIAASRFTTGGRGLREVILNDPATTDGILLASLGALFLAIVAWTGGSLLTARHERKTPVAMFAAAQMTAGGLVTLAISGALGEFSQATWPPKEALWALLYLIVVGSWIGYGCYVYVLRACSTGMVSSIQYANTTVGVLVGWLLGKEQLTWNMLVGAAIVMGGMVIINRNKAAK